MDVQTKQCNNSCKQFKTSYPEEEISIRESTPEAALRLWKENIRKPGKFAFQYELTENYLDELLETIIFGWLIQRITMK